MDVIKTNHSVAVIDFVIFLFSIRFSVVKFIFLIIKFNINIADNL